jgi:ribulose-5-phosphate 4-epimerase/fuculose-1-phosphate aldolase
MMSLIVHLSDPDGKIVPQLHETAAWLAGMVPDVFREIEITDPEVLPLSDTGAANVEDRATLVNNLLRLCDEEKLLKDAGMIIWAKALLSCA